MAKLTSNEQGNNKKAEHHTPGFSKKKQPCRFILQGWFCLLNCSTRKNTYARIMELKNITNSQSIGCKIP